MERRNDEDEARKILKIYRSSPFFTFDREEKRMCNSFPRLLDRSILRLYPHFFEIVLNVTFECDFRNRSGRFSIFQRGVELKLANPRILGEEKSFGFVSAGKIIRRLFDSYAEAAW